MAEACGASLVVDAYGPQVVFARRASLAELQAGAVAPLPDWGLLRLEGIDAVKFLHSQTTNDVAKQPPGEARWHGYCTAKGRLLASMLGWRDETAIRLLLPRPLAAPMRKRLSMFVLRAKVALTDDSDGSAVLGLSGAAAPAALATLGLAVPGPMQVAVAGELTVIGLPPCPVSAASEAAGSAAQAPTGLAQTPAQAAALPRWWLIAPIERLPALWSELAGRLAPVDSEAWRWMDIRCGLPRVLPATSEQFVPQMINLDAIGGVSFNKGCYPGQEIVARSHYLGKLKRRAFIGWLPGDAVGASADALPAPGSDVLDAAGAPVGVVVSAAAAPAGGVELLFEAQIAATQGEAGPLQAGGRPLQLRELPYPLPAN